ncbi:unnamed protein product [Dovyalis caffra]|uniref:SHSP domain-containing protein n=1 Tax=Dovyalis caffra TaxID=77055 RepID=A0AAV1S261_9ROSI|nr:unnamed protein product [Dovyalis caffra]
MGSNVATGKPFSRFINALVPSISSPLTVQTMPPRRQGLNLPKLRLCPNQKVDLPGVSQGTVRVWGENKTVYFEGEDAKNDEEFDKESPRKFKGNIPLVDKLEYKIDEMKYVVKDGVLKVRMLFDVERRVVTSAHPYVVEGSNYPMNTLKEGEASYVRVDLPGVTMDAVKVWIDKDFLYFEGEDPKNDQEHDKEPPRRFKGQIALSTQCFHEADEMKFMLKNGVLMVMIPFKE